MARNDDVGPQTIIHASYAQSKYFCSCQGICHRKNSIAVQMQLVSIGNNLSLFQCLISYGWTHRTDCHSSIIFYFTEKGSQCGSGTVRAKYIFSLCPVERAVRIIAYVTFAKVRLQFYYYSHVQWSYWHAVVPTHIYPLNGFGTGPLGALTIAD